MTNDDLQNIAQKTKKMNNTNFTKRRGWTEFLLHMWHPLCYCCYKLGDKSWM